MRFQLLGEQWGLLLYSLNLPLYALQRIPFVLGERGDGTRSLGQDLVSSITRADPGVDVYVSPLFGVHDVCLIFKAPTRESRVRVVESAGEWVADLAACRRNSEQCDRLLQACVQTKNTLEETYAQEYSIDFNKLYSFSAQSRYPESKSINPPVVFGFSYDPLIPLYVNNEMLTEATAYAKRLVSLVFLRLDPRIAAGLVDGRNAAMSQVFQQMETVLQDTMVSNCLGAVFAGLGLYQLIVVLLPKTLEELAAAKNPLRQGGKLQVGGIDRYTSSTSSTLIGMPEATAEEHDRVSVLDQVPVSFSTLLKIRSGYHSDEHWKLIQSVARSVGLPPQQLTTESLPMFCEKACWCIGERQGYFDAIVASLGATSLGQLSDFVRIIGTLARFVEDTATVVRLRGARLQENDEEVSI